MKPVSTISILRQPLIAFILLFAMQAPAQTPSQAQTPYSAQTPSQAQTPYSAQTPSQAQTPVRQVLLQAGNKNPLASTETQKVSGAGPGCQWTYYPISGAKLQAEQPLYNDPGNTPIIDLSVGNMFKGKTATLARSGATDFDGDNKSDVFRTFLRGDGSRQWQYSSGGTGNWQDLAFASGLLPTSQLQFGDFNGDVKTDVFGSLYNNGLLAYQWLYSPSGTDSFNVLHETPSFPERLVLGDFNGDGVTDVFTATQTNGTYQWGYSPNGSGNLINLAHAGEDPNLLRFGDFDGDGKSDVFAAAQLPDGSTQWLYSSGGALSYTHLITTTIPYSELKFGDFDGDGKTDVLAALPQSNNSLHVVYWSGGLGGGVALGDIPGPAPALRVGDFNGDGISDLLALRCGMGRPLTFTSVQTLAQSGYNTFNRTLTGDVNGDGLTDLIFISNCQNPNLSGFCASHHLQVSTALGTPTHTYSLVAPHQLGADAIDFNFYKVLAGDYDGDGKTDLAVVGLGTNTLSIYVARSNGDGTFTMGSEQTFGGETWGEFNTITGDYNGDGKDDLAFATVCIYANNSCSVGSNNLVYVALSSGSGVFTLGARHDLGGAGWDNFQAFAGDFNGDGKTDLVFNSTCQKTNYIDSTCTVGDANLLYSALSNGLGGFTLSSLQTYGVSGWADYPSALELAGDLNGDGRSDLVWFSNFQNTPKTYNNLVAVGFANPDGTFQLGSVQNLGADWSGRLSLADLNRDGMADLVWNNAPNGNTDVDTYAAALSNGNGTFNSLGPGSVYTGLGFFYPPESNAVNKLAAGLTLISNRQDSISSALFVIDSTLKQVVYLPFVKK